MCNQLRTYDCGLRSPRSSHIFFSVCVQGRVEDEVAVQHVHLTTLQDGRLGAMNLWRDYLRRDLDYTKGKKTTRTTNNDQRRPRDEGTRTKSARAGGAARPISLRFTRTGKFLSSDPSSILPAVNIHLQKWSRASRPVAAARRVSARSGDGSGVRDGHPRRALGDSRSTGRLRGLSLGLCRWCSNICSNYPSSIGRWRSRDGRRNGRHSGGGGCGHG